MNRITQKFEQLTAEKRGGLVGYMTAGDPDLDRSEQDLRTAIAGGVDILELGVPFSDPTADGPIIQEAAQRALAAGMTYDGVLELVRRVRRDSDVPIVLFGYVNPLHHRGYEKACREAADAGADGMLVVDLPYEEASEIDKHLAACDLHRIPLVAPTTPAERAKRILSSAGGFVYYIMVLGVTGARARVASDLEQHVRDLRACTELPIAAGFGVSNGEQAAQVARVADAVVVGSAFVQAAREDRLAEVVADIRAGIDSAAPGSR